MYEIDFTRIALDDLHFFRKFEQNLILDAIDQQLRHEPTTETGNRFRRDPPEISEGNCGLASFVCYMMRMTL